MKKQHFKLALLGGMLVAMSATVNAQWTETATAVYLNNGTKPVGIGTTAPSYPLDIKQAGNCNFRVQSITSGSSNLILSRSAAAGSNCLVNYKTGTTALWYTGVAGNSTDFKIRNGAGTDNLIISQATGNVGLGVATPLVLLDAKVGKIIGTSATNGTYHSLGNQGEKVSFGYNPSSALGEFAGMKVVVNPGTNLCGNSSDILFNTWECNTSTSRPVMAINGTGNVGIGTTTPQGKLHINGGDLVLDNSNQRFFENGNPTWDISGGSSNYAIGRSGNDYPFVIDYATANVGIGTTTPAAKLDVTGRIRSVETGIGFEQVDPVNNVSVGSYADADGGWYGTNSNHPLSFYTNFGSPSMTLATSGNVGIGTSTPVYTLEVNGSAGKPGGGSWTATSDARLKQNVQQYNDGLAQILKINPVKYHYNEWSGYDTKPEHVGVLAQELKEYAPYMVGTFNKEGKEYYNVDNSAMTYMLINAVKELSTKLEDMQVENSNLKSCVESLCNNGAESKVGSANDSPFGGQGALFQNTPNPFNQTTVIRYALNSENTSGKIIIRDLNGNLVKQISIANTGKGEVTINANELAAGTYTYTLEITGASVDTKLMVVTK